MKSSKVIITNPKKMANLDSFENQVGLSSYDLALISINKLTNKRIFSTNTPPITTYLI